MKHTVRLSGSVWLAILLSNTSGIAQSRFPTEAGRGFPFSSGENWSGCLGIGVVVLVLIIVFTIAGAVWDVLVDKHSWHIIPLAIFTLAGAMGLAGALYRNVDYPPEPGFIGFMLIPSFVVVGLVYLAIMKSVQARRDKRRG